MRFTRTNQYVMNRKCNQALSSKMFLGQVISSFTRFGFQNTSTNNTQLDTFRNLTLYHKQVWINYNMHTFYACVANMKYKWKSNQKLKLFQNWTQTNMCHLGFLHLKTGIFHIWFSCFDVISQIVIKPRKLPINLQTQFYMLQHKNACFTPPKVASPV